MFWVQPKGKSLPVPVKGGAVRFGLCMCGKKDTLCEKALHFEHGADLFLAWAKQCKSQKIS